MISYLKRGLAIASIVLASYLPNTIIKNSSLENILVSSCQAQELANDGSSEPGFIPPPELRLPPPPPANMASAETFIPYPPPPAQPQARSEKKNPPSPPILMAKIKQGEARDWNATPNDVNGLMTEMKKNANANYSSEVKSLADISSDPEKNPILYKSTHYRFSFNEQERKKLREYLLAGGTLIINPGRGSRPAFESAVSEIQTMFPETRMLPLGLDHPALHSYYDISKVKCQIGTKGEKTILPVIMGLTINCRTMVFVPELGLDAGWSGKEGKRDIDRIYSEESSRKIGMNVITYATSMRAWQKNFVHASKFVDIDKTSAGKVSITQIVYDGEWKTRHAGLDVLLQGFNARTDIPVKFARNEIKLSDTKIFDSPIIYITGHERFSLSEPELKIFREYVSKGGVVFAEACCGRKGFDSSFREQMKKVFPESSLEKIPQSDSIFKMPNNIQTLEITPALAGKIGKPIMLPELEAIKIGNYYGVIYSQFGLAGGWEMSPNPYSLSYGDLASSALGQNILMSIMTR